jgi:hypothetical protein
MREAHIEMQQTGTNEMIAGAEEKRRRKQKESRTTKTCCRFGGKQNVRYNILGK